MLQTSARTAPINASVLAVNVVKAWSTADRNGRSSIRKAIKMNKSFATDISGTFYILLHWWSISWAFPIFWKNIHLRTVSSVWAMLSEGWIPDPKNLFVNSALSFYETNQYTNTKEPKICDHRDSKREPMSLHGKKQVIHADPKSLDFKVARRFWTIGFQASIKWSTKVTFTMMIPWSSIKSALFVGLHSAMW